MEEKGLLQSISDDEVMVRQADGAFKKIKLSALSAVPVVRKQPSSPVQTPPLVAPVSLPVPLQPKSVPPVLPPSSVPNGPAADFESQAEALLGRLATDIAPDLKSRVKMLLMSYMKGIRQEYAVRERLLQSVENGGLGWTDGRADLFLKQMKAFSGQVSQESAPPPAKPITLSQVNKVSSASSDAMNKKIEPNLLPEIEPEMHVSKMSEAPPQPRVVPQPKPVSLPRVVPPKPEPKKQEPLSVPPISRTSDGIRASTPQVLKIVEEKGEKPRVVQHTDAIASQKQPPHIAIPQTPSGKADVKDIAYKPRLVGPIDELRTLTLVDFRRLSRNPQVAADKIHSKVDLLGEESFEKKIKGVLAWRACEVNQLYNTLLNESLTSKKPVKEVLAARVSRKEPTLTTEEFQAVMNLNRQLRF
ncbi:MAG: Protein TonB [Candidatus Magasanikbacteria bacterium GW2011_GWA2_45_39]|uniref:Protein TonB n=1 Tax=Candidatus Magasanikbacteria bacterium GW2011_GWA2_45_39 TaxID=1619041 RepID=A0A0G1MFC0_9BACT|nr:MAG: Protein TonB [Candidatus Magasanikbacteria bacterium GW2011_GWA2_45_39]HBW74335.1 hypothetical protein [Candidatus Magasanikbacteria bacterium]